MRPASSLPRPSKRWTASALLAIVVACLVASSLGQRYFGHYKSGKDLDFQVYYLAAQMLAADRHAVLYEGATGRNPQLQSAPEGSAMMRRARAAGLGDVEMYLYPPLLADLLRPLSRLGLGAAGAVWRMVNLLLVAGSMMLLARMLGFSLSSAQFGMMVLAGFAAFPMHEALTLGQITILMLALWAGGVYCFDRGWMEASGALFALAAAIKVTPILLVPLFVLWKQGRWLLFFGSTLLLLTLGMVALHGTATMIGFAHVMGAMGGSVPALQNKCLGSVVAWMYYGRIFSLPEVQQALLHPNVALAVAGKLVSLLFYAVCLLLAWRGGWMRLMEPAWRRARTGGRAAHSASKVSGQVQSRTVLLAVFALVIMLTAPVSWRHGYAMALVPIALLWGAAQRERHVGLRTALLALTTFTMGTLSFDLLAQLHLPGLLRVLAGAVWPLSCAALCLEVLWRGVGGEAVAAEHRATEAILPGAAVSREEFAMQP